MGISFYAREVCTRRVGLSLKGNFFSRKPSLSKKGKAVREVECICYCGDVGSGMEEFALEEEVCPTNQ